MPNSNIPRSVTVKFVCPFDDFEVLRHMAFDFSVPVEALLRCIVSATAANYKSLDGE